MTVQLMEVYKKRKAAARFRFLICRNGMGAAFFIGNCLCKLPEKRILRLFSENIKCMARNAKKILPLAGSKMVFQKQSKGIVIHGVNSFPHE